MYDVFILLVHFILLFWRIIITFCNQLVCVWCGLTFKCYLHGQHFLMTHRTVLKSRNYGHNYIVTVTNIMKLCTINGLSKLHLFIRWLLYTVTLPLFLWASGVLPPWGQHWLKTAVEIGAAMPLCKVTLQLAWKCDCLPTLHKHWCAN